MHQQAVERATLIDFLGAATNCCRPIITEVAIKHKVGSFFSAVSSVSAYRLYQGSDCRDILDDDSRGKSFVRAWAEMGIRPSVPG